MVTGDSLHDIEVVRFQLFADVDKQATVLLFG
jgi:hypothetical protein